MKRVKSAFIFLTLVLCLPVLGQITRGNLSGLIKDATGGTVWGGKAAAVPVETGVVFRTATDKQGAYVFPSLPPGKFTVTIEAAGFKRIEMQNIVVEISTPAVASIALEVGQLAESVVVSSD